MKTKIVLGTPAYIGLLLQVHTTGKVDRPEAPVSVEGMRFLTVNGAIEPYIHDQTNNTFTTTPLGRAWVKALCQVPIPQTAYIDEAGNVIKYT